MNESESDEQLTQQQNKKNKKVTEYTQHAKKDDKTTESSYPIMDELQKLLEDIMQMVKNDTKGISRLFSSILYFSVFVCLSVTVFLGNRWTVRSEIWHGVLKWSRKDS